VTRRLFRVALAMPLLAIGLGTASAAARVGPVAGDWSIALPDGAVKLWLSPPSRSADRMVLEVIRE
jgi:hypothetical protein